MTIINKNKIIKVNGFVENKSCEIFLDSCANLNAITRSTLNKLKINKPAIGTISETILQSYSNSTIASEVVELKISIGCRTFVEYFRIIEKDDIFEVLIGIDSLKKNRFDINLVKNKLYYIDENNNSTELVDLYYDINSPIPNPEDYAQEEHIEQNPMLITVTVVNDENNDANDSDTIKQNIIDEIIQTIPENFKKIVKELFYKILVLLQ